MLHQSALLDVAASTPLALHSVRFRMTAILTEWFFVFILGLLENAGTWCV